MISHRGDGPNPLALFFVDAQDMKLVNLQKYSVMIAFVIGIASNM